MALDRAEGAPPPASPVLGGFCTIPMGYNFCATSECLRHITEATGAPRAALLSQLTQADTESSDIIKRLGIKVLHWPGTLRKPWQHCLPAARSDLDEIWWNMFSDACASAPHAATCTISCAFRL